MARPHWRRNQAWRRKRQHTGQRGAQAIRSIIAEHAGDSAPTTLLAVGHGSWIVATVAVLLDMDPDDLNNLGAMRNAFWTRMSVNASRGPAEPDTWQWKLDASTKARPSPRLRTGRTVRRNCTARTCRCGSPSCSDMQWHAVAHGGRCSPWAHAVNMNSR